jgi:multisubunit Na+/H+ antiporter MnhB subunit
MQVSKYVDQLSARPTRKVRNGAIAGLISTAVTAAIVSMLSGQKINLSEDNQKAVDVALQGLLVTGISFVSAYLSRNETSDR